MNKETFKKIAREEFGVNQFSKPECFAKMEEVFGTPGRTFQNWVHKDSVRPYFDAALHLYFENKRKDKELSEKDHELLRLTQEFVKISERIENI